MFKNNYFILLYKKKTNNSKRENMEQNVFYKIFV